MRIAVIDDEKYSRIVLTHQIRQLLPQAEVAQAASGAQAMELLERQSFDVLFIDIRLGDMEGTTIAALARRLMPRAKIIFATAYSEFAVKAFELRADDYILKPFDPERIRQALERCMEPQPEAAAPQPRPLHRIAVSSNRSTTLLDTEDITYIETDGVGRGCVIHTISGKRYNDSTPLGEYETRLEGEQFYRVHKTSLVHLKYVDSIFPWTGNGFALRVRGEDTVLPISQLILHESYTIDHTGRQFAAQTDETGEAAS